MASNSSEAVEDALFQQARAVHGREFDEWVGNLRQTLELNERGPNCLTLLRQLYVLAAVTKHSRSISPVLFTLLRGVILEPEQGPPRIRLAAAAVLRELSPSPSITVKDFNPPVEESNISFVLPVILAQGNSRDKLSQLATQVVRWLSQPGYNEELTTGALSCLHSLCVHGHALDRISEEQFRVLNNQLASWLRHASRTSLSVPSSGISLFSLSGPSKKQLLPVKEIDGSLSQDIFTVLNIGGFFSTDQVLNAHVFSFLRRWLQTAFSLGSGGPSPSPAPTPTPESRGHSPLRSSSRSLTPLSYTSSLPSPIPTGAPSSLTSSLTASLVSPGRSKQGLRDTAVAYCLRLIDQSERKPLKPNDDEVVDACLYESISILDLLCSVSRSLTHSIFPVMRKLYARLSQDPLSHDRVLLALVKFFIKHGESEMYDSETPTALFFGEVLSMKFSDPGLTYDTVEYLLDNTEVLLNTTNIFAKYFPNLLKTLAWSPVTYVAEFLQLLPAFISPATASEVLHSLLDLPCLAATLQAMHLISAVPMVLDMNLLPQYAKSLAAFQDPTNKLMFGHFLRSVSGRGDTIDRLNSLHHLLADFTGHQRVLAAAQIVPLLLKVFFQTVLHGGDTTVISQQVVLLLERSVLLFSIPSFLVEARRAIAEQLLLIFSSYPHLLVDHHQDLLDYLGNLRNLSAGGEHCYVHVAWILGEYSHTGYDTRCNTALLVKFFETLESVAYEVSLNLNQECEYTTRLVLILMSTVAKIASRCQDLIPRALLCLNKIVQLSSENSTAPSTRSVLLARANELVNVLKMPSVASAVLSPPPRALQPTEVERQMAVTYLLQSTSKHLQT